MSDKQPTPPTEKQVKEARLAEATQAKNMLDQAIGLIRTGLFVGADGAKVANTAHYFSMMTKEIEDQIKELKKK